MYAGSSALASVRVSVGVGSCVQSTQSVLICWFAVDEDSPDDTRLVIADWYGKVPECFPLKNRDFVKKVGPTLSGPIVLMEVTQSEPVLLALGMRADEEFQ